MESGINLINNLLEQAPPPKKGKGAPPPKKGKGTPPPKKGGSGNTGGTTGGSGGGVTPTVTQQPAVTPTVTASPPPVTPPIQRQQPLPEPGPKKDVNFCKCWTEGNFFEEDFPKEERNSMANKFYSYASRQKISKGTFDRVEANVASKNCGDSNCLFYQNPTIRELSRAQVATSNLTNTQNLYEVWKETIDQKKAAEEKPKPELAPESPKIYLPFTDAGDFFSDAKGEKIYTVGSPTFRKNLDDLQLIYNTKDCKLKSQMYYDLYERSAHLSFGDPDKSEYTNYEITSKYWYNFLETLMEIKESLKICKNELKPEIMNKISKILDTSVWNLNLQRVGYSKKDNENLAKAKSNVKSNVRSEQLVIRKKLIEYKEMKTLKESVRNKILLTKENKDKKVNKISENLYKIAGDFYNDRYDVFFEKYVRLKESYKKSKMFLTEGASDNFKNAFVRVFKGDEEELVRVAIPWFTSKLGLEGTVKAEVEEKLKNKYSGDDIADLFEDDWSDIVVLSIINNAKSDVSEPTNAMDAVEKALMSNMRADFKEDLKNSIKNLIYPVQDSRKTEIVNLANELKNAILASKDGEESQEDTDSKVDDIFS